MRAVVLVALCACSIKPIDYTGKQCEDRCPDGYLCNLVTHTCARELTMDGAVTMGDARPPDAAVDKVSDSCFQNPRSTLVYSSVGFGDYPQGWLVGDGNWERRDGELYQSSSAADITWVSHAITSGSGSGGVGGDYRIVATMRMPDLGDGSIGIAFRVGTLTMYTCAVEPVFGSLALRYMQQGIDLAMATKPVMIANPTGSFTIEIDATGTNLSCCIRGVSGATLSVMNANLIAGRAGLSTRNVEAAFASLYAYE